MKLLKFLTGGKIKEPQGRVTMDFFWKRCMAHPIFSAAKEVKLLKFFTRVNN